MEAVTLSHIDTWKAISLPRVVSSDWDPANARTALGEIKRLQGELDAAKTVLVGIVAVEAGRDTKATVVRELGVSQVEANRIVRAAGVVARVDGVADGIAFGEFSLDHVQRIAKLKEDSDVAELLMFASTESPDDFGKRIDTFLINSAGVERRARQRAERSVKFFSTDEGSIGMRAVFPETEGKLLKANLKAIMNRQYLDKYPERARVAGGHNPDSYEQRLADALIEAINGDAPISEEPVGDDVVVVPGHGRVYPNECVEIPHWVSDLGEYEHLGPGCTVTAKTVFPPTSTRTDKREKRKKRRGKRVRETRARTAVIVTISLEQMNAQILGDGPIRFDDALGLIDRTRSDLFFCVQNEVGAVMKFGRSRRFATEFQKFALAVQGGGVCSWPGCDVSWDQCEADHVPDWKPKNPGDPLGQTDIDKMKDRCKAHHKHRHETGQNPTRNPDGTWNLTAPELTEVPDAS
jgi:hypothetical protein